MRDKNEPDGAPLSRRAMMGTAAAIASTPALAQVCQVGPPPHAKGPKVWLDMDQVELDTAYDQTAYAPMIDQIQKRYASSSETSPTAVSTSAPPRGRASTAAAASSSGRMPR